MIAAPRGYDFGTKINLEGLGVVSVHDRGGAITSTPGGADRIDIWMGFGDEGLKRTQAWGRRELTGTIVSKDAPVSIDLNTIVTQAPQATDLAKQRLKALGYDTSKKFSDVILEFQLDYAVIPSTSDPGAGVYGPKTTTKLREVYNNFLTSGKIATKAEAQSTTIAPSETRSTSVSFGAMSETAARELAQNMKLPSLGQSAIGVTNLQNFLASKGMFNGQANGEMNLATLGALRKYQHSKNIIQTGRTDIKTQQFIIADLMK